MKAVSCLFLAAVLLLAHNVQAKDVAPNWRYSGVSAKDVPQMILFTVRFRIESCLDLGKHQLPPPPNIRLVYFML
jgi:hypothetical protein